MATSTRGGTKRKDGVESRKIEYVFSVDWTASVEIREWTSCRNHVLNMYSYAGEIREEQDRLNEELNKAESGHSEVVYLTKESALAAAEKRFVDLCNKYWQPEPEPEFDHGGYYYPDEKEVQNPKDTPSLHLQGGDKFVWSNPRWWHEHGHILARSIQVKITSMNVLP